MRDENTQSFKINKSKNVWYDHGLGKGGKLVDFVMQFHRLNVSEALQKIASFPGQNNILNNAVRPLYHPQEDVLFPEVHAGESAIKIIAAKQPIEDLILCQYLLQRNIEKTVADRYCYEVIFSNKNKEKEYKAIGFKNNAGGDELRNEYFKGSSSPKWVSYLDKKSAKLTVFEGFFDFITYQTIHQNQQQELSNFLILNSLPFFARSLLLMEKHDMIQLHLDHDNAGRKCTKLALKRSSKFCDESNLYQGYKDLKDWKMNFGKLLKKTKIIPIYPHA